VTHFLLFLQFDCLVAQNEGKSQFFVREEGFLTTDQFHLITCELPLLDIFSFEQRLFFLHENLFIFIIKFVLLLSES